MANDVRVHLVDGTYELFRHHFGVPAEVRATATRAAVRGVVGSVVAMLAEGATHVGVATDHVIESFRNRLWPGYKDGSGVAEELLAQFVPLEEALTALGVVVWPMVELEADDALASAAAVCAADPAVVQVVICTPDKDLAQCVVGQRVVQLDRRKGITSDEAGVVARFGVGPASVPDWLAVVGDSADGFPGLPGWGAKAAAAVLRRYRHLEDVPRIGERWDVDVRGARSLANTLAEQYELALLFRDLATLRTTPPVVDSAEALRWLGPAPGFAELCAELGAPALAGRAAELAAARAGSGEGGI
ncbi:MAG TPA: 5'-3' exonuclease H3TH domain-containing protein [Acidimicrobiales bacterium]|nr:5'-3' exonuclease H3TH domain-containing protein [Acidimicrobiales bacterium]